MQEKHMKDVYYDDIDEKYDEHNEGEYHYADYQEIEIQNTGHYEGIVYKDVQNETSTNLRKSYLALYDVSLNYAQAKSNSAEIYHYDDVKLPPNYAQAKSNSDEVYHYDDVDLPQ